MYFANRSAMDRSLMQCQNYGPVIPAKAELKNAALWRKFHAHQTEMILTKGGRRMYPTLELELTQLDPDESYCVVLEIAPVDNCRYKYSSSAGWTAAGSEEPQNYRRTYLHPQSPATGRQWMSQTLSLARVKLTNTPSAQHNEQIVLSSMNKYIPKIYVYKSRDTRFFGCSPFAEFCFAETQFIAVTAYQNDKITKLKIDNNPFAKGFRENGQARCKRKLSQATTDVVEMKDDAKKRKFSETSTVSVSSGSLTPREGSPQTLSLSSKTPSPYQSPNESIPFTNPVAPAIPMSFGYPSESRLPQEYSQLPFMYQFDASNYYRTWRPVQQYPYAFSAGLPSYSPLYATEAPMRVSPFEPLNYVASQEVNNIPENIPGNIDREADEVKNEDEDEENELIEVVDEPIKLGDFTDFSIDKILRKH